MAICWKPYRSSVAAAGLSVAQKPSPGSYRVAGTVAVKTPVPGFVRTEGFPATELREKALTRWVVSEPEKVAEAIYECGPGGKAERYVPRPYALAAIARILMPRLTRRVLSGGAASSLTTSTGGQGSASG